MNSTEPVNYTSLIIQFLVLATGIVLIFSHRYWNRGPAVIASGVFFINLFWITMVLSYDLKIWALLRNTVTGGILMLSIIIINLIVVLVLAVFGNIFK